MNKICTSIDQSKKLIELGIDVDTADMLWQYIPSKDNYASIPCVIPITPYVFINDIPAWSLSALLELIPKEQHPELVVNAHYKWICDISNPFSFAYKPTAGDNPLDVAFEMVCWLKENGKI